MKIIVKLILHFINNFHGSMDRLCFNSMKQIQKMHNYLCILEFFSILCLIIQFKSRYFKNQVRILNLIEAIFAFFFKIHHLYILILL